MLNALRWIVFAVAALAMNVPVIVTVITSFKTPKELLVNPGFWINQPTFDNYLKVLQVSDRLNIFAYFWNSLTASLIGSALAIILAFPAAYAMARGGFGRKTLLPAIVNLRAVPLIIFDTHARHAGWFCSELPAARKAASECRLDNTASRIAGYVPLSHTASVDVRASAPATMCVTLQLRSALMQTDSFARVCSEVSRESSCAFRVPNEM